MLVFFYEIWTSLISSTISVRRIWISFLEFEVKEIKTSSILDSKLRGFVDMSCPVNLKSDKSLAISLLFTMEYFYFKSLDYSFVIFSYNRLCRSSSWNLFERSFWLIESRSEKEDKIVRKHCCLVFGSVAAIVINKLMYCLVVSSYFRSYIYLMRSLTYFVWLFGVLIKQEAFENT